MTEGANILRTNECLKLFSRDVLIVADVALINVTWDSKNSKINNLVSW